MKEFKPCPGCPTPAKCKKAGKCMKEYAKKEGYKSVRGMKMHEGKESKAMEAKEKKQKRMK